MFYLWNLHWVHAFGRSYLTSLVYFFFYPDTLLLYCFTHLLHCITRRLCLYTAYTEILWSYFLLLTWYDEWSACLSSPWRKVLWNDYSVLPQGLTLYVLPAVAADASILIVYAVLWMIIGVVKRWSLWLYGEEHPGPSQGAPLTALLIQSQGYLYLSWGPAALLSASSGSSFSELTAVYILAPVAVLAKSLHVSHLADMYRALWMVVGISSDCSIYAIYHPKGLHLHLVWPGFRSVTVLALTVMELLSILLAMAPSSRWYSCQWSGSSLQANSFSPLLFFFILLVFIIFSILKEEEVLGFFSLTLFFARDTWPPYGGVFMPDRCDCWSGEHQGSWWRSQMEYHGQTALIPTHVLDIKVTLHVRMSTCTIAFTMAHTLCWGTVQLLL